MKKENPIPAEALAHHIAILGKTGSGKTYAAKGIVESILNDDGRVCVVDPTGAWWGLKSSATGKSGGFPVVVFGGTHGDMPLGGAHGKALAEVVGTSSTPVVLDTSQMTVGERTRFFTDFANDLLRKNRGPLHLVIDEAHLFAPQGGAKGGGANPEMLHAANNLVSLGRSRGLRIILITQRPAKLHKDSLTQVETLVAMRVIAPQDRNAVEAWIEDNADEEHGAEIISSLATLKTGEGWVWAPEVKLLDRVTFPKIKTFDTSKAPEDADDSDGPVLAPIDREAIEKRLVAVAADAVANDPSKLKAEISRLKGELQKGSKNITQNITDPAAIEEAEQRGFDRAKKTLAATLEREAKAALVQELDVLRATFAPMAGALDAAIKAAKHAALDVTDKVTYSPAPRSIAHTIQPRPAPAPRHTNGHATDSELPKGEKLCLAAMAQYADGVTRQQLTVLTGYKRSTRDAYIQRLRDRSYADLAGDRVIATDAGIAALGNDYEPLPTGEALREHVLPRLPEGERRVLELLIGQYPEQVEREAIDEATGFQRSTRDAYLMRLKARELVEVCGRGAVKAVDELFETN